MEDKEMLEIMIDTQKRLTKAFEEMVEILKSRHDTQSPDPSKYIPHQPPSPY